MVNGPSGRARKSRISVQLISDADVVVFGFACKYEPVCVSFADDVQKQSEGIMKK